MVTEYVFVLLQQVVSMLTIAHSLEEKKAQEVVDEIKAQGGEAIAVGGDVAADDFPQRVLDATIK